MTKKKPINHIASQMNKKAKAFKYHRCQHLYHTVTYTNNNYNIAIKFVYSNSIARPCFIFLLCTLMTSVNISLKKKIFHRVENVIKQLVHTSAVRSSRYEALGKLREYSRSQGLRLEQLLRIFCALQTFRVLQISMNAR